MAMTRTSLIAALLAEDAAHPESKDELVYSDSYDPVDGAQYVVNYVTRTPVGSRWPGRLVVGTETFPDA